MNITFGILYHYLQQKFQVKTNLTPDSDCVIRRFRIWNGETPEKEVLYLSSSLPGNQKAWLDCCCLFLDKKKNPEGWKGRYIQLPMEETDSAGILAAVNILNEIMETFNEWLLFKPETAGDLTRLLNDFEDMTGWPAIVVDRHLHFIAMSRNYYDVAGWIHDRSLSEMPIDYVNELMTDENFRNAINLEEPFFYSYTEPPEASYELSSCFNIRMNGKYKARVLVEPPDNQKHIGQMALTRALGEKAAEMLSSDRQLAGNVENYEFYRMLEHLLKGEKEAELDRRLAVRGWKSDHSYEVLLFSFMETGNGTVTAHYYENYIESIEGECAAFAAEEGICCIRNLTLTTAKEQDIRQRHSMFLRENLCKSGSSQVFCNLQELPTYYREAQIAIKLGNRSGRTEWNYRFEDYQLTYLLKSAPGALSPGELVHPAFRILENYDREKHANLLDTALVYMKCHFNVTKAAEELRIHRTSMLFRLERIETLTGFDWNNWNELLHLSLSYALTERS